MGKIDVARDLVLSFPLVSDENNGGHPSTSHVIFSISKGFQEVGVVNFATGVGERFRLFSVLILSKQQNLLLLLSELLTGQDLSFSMVTNFDKLAS